jgi:hypothetical protein
MKIPHCFRISHLLFVLGFVFLIAAKGAGQSINWVTTPPLITFTIDQGIVVGNQCQLQSPASNSLYSLRYTAGNRIRKIIVSTSCTAPICTLQVAGTVTAGSATAQGPVILNSGAGIDFIRDIPRRSNNGVCRLTYTASAEFSDGTGTDSHTVTYTIMTQ